MTAWKTIEFAGVGGVSGRLPAWQNYLTPLYGVSSGEPTTMKSAVKRLESKYSIKAVPVAYDHSEPANEDTEWRKSARHIALVNPAWLGEGIEDAPQNTAIWHIPTTEYTPVTPMDKYGPLLTRLRARDYHDSASGQFRLFRNGGEVHADVWLDDLRTGDDDEIIMGIQTGHNYFGGKALYASIIAYDEKNDRIMRGLSEKRSRRHIGAAKEDVAEWWDVILDQAEDACEALAEIIMDAQDYVVDFSEVPMTPREYLTYAFEGTTYLAENDDSVDGQTGGAMAYLPPVASHETASLSAWELYAAMASALTHDFNGKDDSTAVRKYVRQSNRQLFAPARMEDSVLSDLADDLEDQEDLEGESVIEDIESRQAAIGNAVARARDDKDRLRTLVEEAESADGATA